MAALTIDVCCQECLNEPTCNAYTFGFFTCYMKTARASGSFSLTLTSARVNKCSATQANVDYPGNDLTDVASSSVDDCCAICRNHEGCVVWSYANGRCWLKSAVGSSVVKTGVSSAVVIS
ncbi:Aste57867_5809 [Aphanomyces stellatus]|uniref:Aste57867_5809 protein n=1 Tax=Aphanomyces stellatus TaxID=120398 RepID=A0A485KDX8_9STRA|nr:hypothetical protein As57867_005795 [Aphanomyces stellatus]VFT82832.1 Aste57867_5809 [Aphanomyces stellatus]